MYCLTAPNTSFSNCSQKMEGSFLIVFSTVSREDVKLCEYGALQRLQEEGFSLLVLVCLLSWLLKHEWLPIHPPSTTGMASYAPCSSKTCSVPSLQLLQCMWLPQCPTSSAQVISLVPRNCIHGCFPGSRSWRYDARHHSSLVASPTHLSHGFGAQCSGDTPSCKQRVDLP